jgi:large subunit ribosomal protein L29
MLLKTKDLREKSATELQDELASLKEQLFKAKMQLSSRQLENSSLLGTLRKSIARIQTLITEKEILAMGGVE